MKVCWLVFCTLLLAGTTGYSQPPEITSQKKWNRIYFQSYDCDFSTAEVKKITKTPSPMFYTDNNQKTNNLTTLVLDLGYKKILSDMPNPGLFAHDQSPHPIRDCSPVFFFDFKEDFATDDIQSMLLVSKTDGKERSKPIKFELADLHSKQSLDWKYPTEETSIVICLIKSCHQRL